MARLSECNRASRPTSQGVLTANLLIFIIALSSSFLTGSCGTRVIRQADAASGLETSLNDTITAETTETTATTPTAPTTTTTTTAPTTTIETTASSIPSTSLTDVLSSLSPPKTTAEIIEKNNETTLGIPSTNATTTLASSEVMDMMSTTPSPSLSPSTDGPTSLGPSATNATIASPADETHPETPITPTKTDLTTATTTESTSMTTTASSVPLAPLSDTTAAMTDMTTTTKTASPITTAALSEAFNTTLPGPGTIATDAQSSLSSPKTTSQITEKNTETAFGILPSNATSNEIGDVLTTIPSPAISTFTVGVSNLGPSASSKTFPASETSLEILKMTTKANIARTTVKPVGGNAVVISYNVVFLIVSITLVSIDLTFLL